MSEHRVTLSPAEIEYLLRLVTEDIPHAVGRGDGGVNLVLVNRLGNMHAWEQERPRATGGGE